MNSTKKINGPINVVRLEGKINGIKKVLYLFMDIHFDITTQTECDDLFAKDIQLYLAESFTNLDPSKEYDFFFEIFPTDIQKIERGPTNINYREKYIWEVVKFFQKLFVYEPSQNKVLMSKIFKNVRLHYADIRNYFHKYFFEQLQHVFYMIREMWQNFGIRLPMLGTIINIINNIKKHCEFILDVIKKGGTKISSKKINLIQYVDPLKGPPKQMTKEEEDQMYSDYINYLVYKMFSVYKNKTVRDKLGLQKNIIEKYLSDIIDGSEKLIAVHTKIGDRIYLTQNKLTDATLILGSKYGIDAIEMTDLLATMKISTDKFLDEFAVCFTRFMDVYFLRRFLDKDYITNALTYTGAYHSQVYIEILIRDFNFKITHAAYSTIPNIDELNVQIKKYAARDMYFLLRPLIQSQCSDMTHFPEKFL